jgi:predicted transcriptional regulator
MSKEFTQQIKKTGHPLVLTVNRKPRFVVQDVKSYQEMLNLIDRLECIDGIRRGLEDVERGRVRPAEEVFEEIRRKYGIPKKA